MPVMLTHDTSIDYDVHGDGPPLLLINGLGFGRWGWFKQIPTLSRHFRTITFDIRGEQNLKNGVADLCAEVMALLDHLDVQKAHVLGTSLGGFVAQEMALSHPERVHRLVLVCTSYGGAAPETMSFQALGKMLGWGSLTPEGALRNGLETATSEAYRTSHPDEFDLIVGWRMADSPSLSAYYQQMMAGARFDVSRNVENISAPTLVIHGADDQYVPVGNASALAEAIPGARLRIFEDAGHLVFIEQAEEVNKEVIYFLKPRKRRRPKKTSTTQKILSFLNPNSSSRRQRPPAKQKTRQLIDRTREVNRGIASFFEPREPRKAKEGFSFEKLSGQLRRAQRFPGEWVRKLRGWLSRWSR